VSYTSGQEFCPDSLMQDHRVVYDSNQVLQRVVTYEEFLEYLPDVVDSLELKPSLSLAISRASVFDPRLFAAVFDVFKSFGKMRRNHSPELTREHQLRVADMTEWVLTQARQPRDIKNSIVVAALAHDMIEDCDKRKEELTQLYGSYVSESVKALSIPTDPRVLHFVYEAVQNSKIYDLPAHPKDSDLKFAFKIYQTFLLNPGALVIKSMDTIDKPSSDAKDIHNGDLKLPNGEMVRISDIREKNEVRHGHLSRYLGRMEGRDFIAQFGEEGSTIIREHITTRFKEAAVIMQHYGAEAFEQQRKDDGFLVRLSKSLSDAARSALRTAASFVL